MLVKEIAFTLPLVIALAEFLFFTEKTRERVFRLVPFACTLCVIPATLLVAKGSFSLRAFGDSMQTLAANPELSRWEYLFTQFRVIVTYLRLLFLPVGQNLDYDYPASHSFFEPAVLISFMALLVIFGLGIFFLYRSKKTTGETGGYFRLLGFGVLWFFITLSVESSIIPIYDVIFEHRLYLPSVGFVLVLVAVAAMVLGRVKPAVSGKVAGAAALVVLLILCGLTYGRNAVWRSPVVLWEDTVRKSPTKPRPHNNLALAYEAEGRIDEAIVEYAAATALDPDYAHGHYNLGVMYSALNRTDDAVRELLRTIELEPDNYRAHNNLGVAYEKQGRLAAAEREYRLAVRFNPSHANAQFNLGKLLDRQRRVDEAIQAYQSALTADPGLAEAHNNLGILYSRIGRTVEATEEIRQAIRLNPAILMAHNNLGILYGTLGRIDAAIDEFLMEIRINPDFHGAYYNLGISYQRQGRVDEAIKAFRQTLERNPEHAGARRNLDVLLRQN